MLVLFDYFGMCIFQVLLQVHWQFWMLQALRYPERMHAAILQRDSGA
jgi:hypothetical protein